MNKPYNIYSLSFNGVPFYVGKTKDLKTRLRKHKSESKLGRTHKENFINKIIANNMDISIDIIDISDATAIDYWECYWIEQFKNWGFTLLNSSEGGEGGDTWSGKNHKQETKNLISNSMKMFYENNPDKIKRFNGEKNGRAKLTTEQVLEIKKLRKDGNSYGKIALRYQVSKTLILDIISGKRWGHLIV